MYIRIYQRMFLFDSRTQTGSDALSPAIILTISFAQGLKFVNEMKKNEIK